MRLIATASAVVLLAALALCPAALADADPASDVLLGEDVFYPYSPPVSPKLQATLDAVVAAAHRARFPIKVALIADPADLGAIPQLFDKPREYAAFLDQEITFAVKAPLLVVMPDGQATAGLGKAASASLPKPSARASNALAQAAVAAVRTLAAVSGHPLGRVLVTRSKSAPGSSGVALPMAILIGVCGALAAGIVAIRRRRGRVAPQRR